MGKDTDKTKQYKIQKSKKTKNILTKQKFGI